MRWRALFFVYLLGGVTACAPGASPLPQAPSLQPANPAPWPPAPGSPLNAPAVGPGMKLAIGATAHSRVELTDPGCFYNWDASGRCRFFELMPSQDGELAAVLRWSTPSGRAAGLMDLFIVEADGSWTWVEDTSREQRKLLYPVKAGQSYVLIAMAYGQAVDFELSALM